LRTFFANIDRWYGLLSQHSHVELAKIILDESGYTTLWMNDKSADAPGRLENLKELVTALEEFDSLPSFLEHVSLVMDNTEKTQGDMVTIMTLHAAKGLEFDTVFLSGWEEGVFPHPRTLDESGHKGLEEERRLAYVGLTRAKHQAIITFSLNRKMHQGRHFSLPSRFISELPAEHIITINPSGSMNSPKPVNERGLREDSIPYLDQKNTQHFSRSDRVFHQKFGYGRVVDVSSDRLEVDFDHSGIKKIIASFVQKAGSS
jgi:DNA helicase-2/ATP-dependent DNA helicase PcrA